MIRRGISFSRRISVQPIQSTKRMMSSAMATCVAPYIQDGWDVRAFQKICGSEVDPISHTKQFLLRHPTATVHVGSDSKRRGSKIVYAVAIVLRIPEQGGHVIFSKRAQNVPSQNSQNQDVFLRLNNEVKQSIEAAEALLDVVDHKKLSVHVDLSSRKKDMSNKIHSMAMGWVSGLSLTALAKPDSWAVPASIVSRLVKYNIVLNIII